MGEVIPLFASQDNEQALKKDGVVKTRTGSPNLYVDFYHHNYRVTLSTGLRNTPENYQTVRKFLDGVIRERDAGVLCFAERFPQAPEDMRVYFAAKEGGGRIHDPTVLTFGEYAQRWVRQILSGDKSHTKRNDYIKMLDWSILPFFGQMTFAEITGVTLRQFVNQLVHKRGAKKGTQLAGSTIRNMLVVFRNVYYDALEENGWELKDPFQYLERNKNIVPKRNDEPPEVFRFEEWTTLLEAMPPFYRPICEFMVLTGMSASEMAGLKATDIYDGEIHVRRAYVGGQELERLKNKYRKRDMPVTVAIQHVLDQIKPRKSDGALFFNDDGTRFDEQYFRDRRWDSAITKSGVKYRKPYTTRHTFAAWSLIIGIHPERLVRLMGHGTKAMVYERYGKYVKDLEKDGELIRKYFGSDFK